MRTAAVSVPRSTTSCPASASSTASRSATPRWSNATATFTPLDPSSNNVVLALGGRSRHPLQQRRGASDHVVGREAELLEHGGAGRGGAEALDRDRVAA